MGHDMICSWLGIDATEWPPNHYRLLGLRPGETDPALIEQRVHQRLDTVRCYQMLHPEQATEAMNRLAQAFVCLTEPNAKQAYDSSLIGAPVPEAPATSATSTATLAATEPASAEPLLEGRETPELTNGAALPPPLPILPPPLPPRLPALPDLDDTAIEDGEGDATTMTPAVAVTPAAPPSEPVDPVVQAAQASRDARRGLGTKRALYYRIARTRALLRAWNHLGQYLASPKRRSLRRSEVNELLMVVGEVRQLLHRFPPLMGEAGKPGYFVLALEQYEPSMLSKIDPAQRESLSRDWSAGHKLLTAHRDFLRQEVRALRKRTLKERLVRAARSFVNDQPGTVLLLLGLVALAAAVVQSVWRAH